MAGLTDKERLDWIEKELSKHRTVSFHRNQENAFEAFSVSSQWVGLSWQGVSCLTLRDLIDTMIESASVRSKTA